MPDRLVDVLKRFELSARVFQTGPLCHSADFDRGDGLGYIHVLKHGEISVKGQSHEDFTLQEPTLFLYMQPCTHSLQPLSEQTDIVCASIDFGAGLSNPITVALPEIVVLPTHSLPHLALALELLFMEAEEAHCGQQAVLDRTMEIVIIQVLRSLMDQQLIDDGILAGLAEPRLEKAINAVHAEPDNDWTLDKLASVAGMSRASFAVKFRETVGMTPGEYITHWRLALARSFLKQGKSIQWVATEVGYANASALSRVFRSMVGMSPSQWLKQSEPLALHSRSLV